MLEEKIQKIAILLNSKYHDRRVSDLVVYVLVFTYFMVFSMFTVARHIHFKTHAFDLGISSQALYTTLFNGKFFYETPDLHFTKSGSFFGVHFSPIVFALLPFYYVYPKPETLLIVQSAVLALAAIPIYFLARLLIKNDNVVPVGFAALYLLNPFIHSLNTYDFHAECFIPLFSISALYYFEKKKWKWFIAFSILSALTIDFAVFIMFFMGIYAILRYFRPFISLMKDKITSLQEYNAIASAFFISVLAVLLLFISIITISYFGPPPLSSTGVGVFSKLGKSYSDIVVNVICEPTRIMDSILYDGTYKIIYLMSLFLSTFFLAVFSPRELVLCVPWTSVVLLTTCNTFYQPNYHLGAFIIPFIMYATIHGFKNIRFRNLWKLQFLKKIKTPLIATLIIMVSLSPLSPLPYFFSNEAAYEGYPIPKKHTELLSEAVSQIPDSASVLAQNHIFPHLANRVEVYVWVPFGVTVDYAIADKKQRDYKTTHVFVRSETFKQQFESLLHSGKYEKIFEKDGIIVLKRRPVFG